MNTASVLGDMWSVAAVDGLPSVVCFLLTVRSQDNLGHV